MAIDDVFLHEPDLEGETPYEDGVTINVTFADSSGGGMDSEGDEL